MLTVSRSRLLLALVAGALALTAAPASAASARRGPALGASARRGGLALLDAHGQVRPGAAIAIHAPSLSYGAAIAHVLVTTTAWSEPGGGRRVWSVAPETMFAHQAQNLMVIRGRFDAKGRPWLEVDLPIRPNHTLAWINGNDVVLLRTRWYVAVDTGQRLVRVYRDGSLVRVAGAVVGKPSTPTPAGLFAIYEIVQQADPYGFLGPWALQLTAFSNVLFNFGAGPGRIAIHGRGGSSLLDPLGTAASHGCIRVDSDVITWMSSSLTAGTPVMIT